MIEKLVNEAPPSKTGRHVIIDYFRATFELLVVDSNDEEIVVREKQYMSGITDKSKQYRKDHVIRHELVHAVAQEWGVPYGDNEDLVDWIAHIIPIVNKAFDDIKQKEAHNG